ncbi:DNA repair protein RecO [Acinetobacter radioresistens]|uniref:DNA repair protein RecO n=1 Tax=Acinetobacter radioresistens TaxID=40216 RepID=UPI0022469BA5|nr:DNA repair protein RecO [Acinetobacter radioresistens]MCX0339278.1 DNA repair protein RecO [Acinetobacter radioresistens]
MRNEALHGYLIHYRKYREKSHLVYLFTEEYGRIDGILRQVPPPQYQPLALQASGKGELKNFSKLEIVNQPIFFYGDAFFSGFYLNELLLRLCPLEEPMPQTYQQYQLTLVKLQQLAVNTQPGLLLRQILRQFEHILLEELGYAIDFSVDAHQQPVEPERHYHFQIQEGFIPVQKASSATLAGQSLLTMLDYEKGADFSQPQLQLLSRLYRQMITSLLGDRPLKSRQLWIQNTHSQS